MKKRTKRWSYKRDGRTFYVYADIKPNILGIKPAGYYDYETNTIGGNHGLCNQGDKRQFQDWKYEKLKKSNG